MTYIPRPDDAFNVWQQNFLVYVNNNFAALGLVFADTIPVNTAFSAWKVAYADNRMKRHAAENTTQGKDAARIAFEAALRPLIRRLQASSPTVVSDAERAALGLTVRVSGKSPPQPITSRPMLTVDTAGRMRHTLRFTDESTPASRAKPRGVVGAEVWTKVIEPGDPPPTDPAELRFLTLATRAPAVLELPSADVNKTAVYMLRWVGKGGAAGPWSEPVAATVAA